jgi:hypothetical protein
MILLGADVLLLDIRYPRDVRFGANERLLKTLREQNIERGITLYALLEVIGILSFNLPTEQIQPLYTLLPGQYGLQVIPVSELDQETPAFSLSEIIGQVEKKMALGDALQVLYVRRFALQATCFLSWNARHFQEKFPVPALTPEEWLTENAS